MAKARLSVLAGPLPRTQEWTAMWDEAAAKWPGVELGYIGTDEAGQRYFQVRGNPVPYILTKEV